MGMSSRQTGADAASVLASTQVTCMLPVKDMARARRFYEDALGLVPLGAKSDGKFVYHCGGTELALFPKPEGTKAEHTAISFKVADIATAITELKSRGVAFEEYDLPGFKTVEHVCVLGSERAAWFRDPEGNILCLQKTSADGGVGEDGDPAPRPFFHEGMRAWQDRFDSRRLADRLEERLGRKQFNAEDRAFIESRTMFFLDTADAAGLPDCSYKGGDAGFVRVTGDNELAFPSYDGNGMFRSIGNLSTHAPVGLLFIDFEQPRRLRVNGLASLMAGDPLCDEFTGAQLVVRVRATHIFPNCPRYIHHMQLAEPSPYVPRPGVEPPVPAWKQFEMFSDVLPRDGRGGGASESG